MWMHPLMGKLDRLLLVTEISLVRDSLQWLTPVEATHVGSLIVESAGPVSDKVQHLSEADLMQPLSKSKGHIGVSIALADTGIVDDHIVIEPETVAATADAVDAILRDHHIAGVILSIPVDITHQMLLHLLLVDILSTLTELDSVEDNSVITGVGLKVIR